MGALDGVRVLLTGGSGFLGSHLRDALVAAGADVIAPRRAELDLTDARELARALREQRVQRVVHAAAEGGGIGWMRHHPGTSGLANAAMAVAVVQACVVAHQAWGLERLVGVSSACAYAVDAPQPMTEAALFHGEPEPTNGPYGHAKRLMLVLGRAAAEEFGLDCGFVVPTNLYGPRDHFSLERSHVVAALIRRFEEARRRGDPEVVAWGSGRATRDLLFVRDAVAGVMAALCAPVGEGGMKGGAVNLGSGQERTIREIAAAVAAAVGYEGHTSWDATKPDGMPRKVLDTQRAAEVLQWRAEVPLEDGLRETVAWWRAQEGRG